VSDSKRIDVDVASLRVRSDAPAYSGSRTKDEAFAVRLLSRGEIAALAACGLIEHGPSSRSAVGDTGYRLTRRGWEVVALLWYDRGPDAVSVAPVIQAS